jgi:hypothetical protein
MNSYLFWQESLAGLKPKMFVDDPQCGFYRKGTYERDDKGNNRRIGWTPVAIFQAIPDGEIIARVGSENLGRDVAGDELNELWTHVAANAISEGAYREVARHGKPWPDAHDPSKNKIADVVTSVTEPKTTLKVTLPPEQKLIGEIANAQAGVSQYDKIDSDTMAGQALSLKNEIVSLAGKLDKVRVALVQPHVEAQRTINDRFNPIIKRAQADAKKLLGALGAWNDTKREAAKAAEQSGQPANAPAPSTQIAAAVGRKASVKVAKIVTAIDLDNAFVFFRAEEWLYDALLKRAQGAVDAGLTVPGATIEERSVVR